MTSIPTSPNGPWEWTTWKLPGCCRRREFPPGLSWTSGDAVNDPHANERGFFEEIYQEDCGVHKYPGAPFRFAKTDTSIRRGPVRLGEDNEYVYRTVMGYSEEEYADFERLGHIGTEYDPGV